MGPNTVFTENFGKFNLGEDPLPPGDELSGGGGVGTFPNYLNGCAAQQGHDFGTLSFTVKLGLSCCVSNCLLLREVWVKP